MLVIFNLHGLLFLGIGFAAAFALGAFAGWESEAEYMLVLGPMVAGSDLAFRLLHKTGHWFWPRSGGHLFFLPVWMYGLLWTVLGVIDYTAR